MGPARRGRRRVLADLGRDQGGAASAPVTMASACSMPITLNTPTAARRRAGPAIWLMAANDVGPPSPPTPGRRACSRRTGTPPPGGRGRRRERGGVPRPLGHGRPGPARQPGRGHRVARARGVPRAPAGRPACPPAVPGHRRPPVGTQRDHDCLGPEAAELASRVSRRAAGSGSRPPGQGLELGQVGLAIACRQRHPDRSASPCASSTAGTPAAEAVSMRHVGAVRPAPAAGCRDGTTASTPPGPCGNHPEARPARPRRRGCGLARRARPRRQYCRPW